jgi:hypothetical protein
VTAPGQQALRQGLQVRRGQGDSLPITAAPQTHRELLAAAEALDSEGISPADSKANRLYRNRLNNVSM